MYCNYLIKYSIRKLEENSHNADCVMLVVSPSKYVIPSGSDNNHFFFNYFSVKQNNISELWGEVIVCKSNTLIIIILSSLMKLRFH